MPSHHDRSAPGLGDYALLVLLGAIWGLTFILIRMAVSSVPAVPMVMVRLVLSTVLMAALMWWLGQSLPPRGRVWWFLLLSAVFGNSLPFLLIAWGEEHVDGALAAILMSPSPLVAAALAHVLTADERLDRWKLTGIALGMLGVAVLMGLDSLGRIGDDWLRQLAVLAGGFCYGLNIVLTRWLTGGSAVAIVTALMLISTLLMAPLALLTPGAWSFSPTAGSLAAIVALATLSTCAGTLLLVEIVRRQGAAFSGQVNFLVPLFGVLWGMLVLSERPTLRSLIGLVLILAGVAIARRRSGRAA